jgi:hypothetical protein
MKSLKLTTLLMLVTSMAVALLLATGCNDENKYSHKYPCSFVFHAQYHPTSVLTRSLTNPGMFVIVTSELRQGVTHLLVEPNGGDAKEDLVMSTAIENERTSYQSMGANRSLIVGMSNFDGLKGYDRQCPNCIEELGGVDYPLNFTGDGQIVECSRCHRTYSLMSEGMPTNGEKGDKALMQYIAIYDGTRLYVHN